MSLPLAPPTIFRARAIAATGVPWLADGFHLRVNVSPWIGFPLHPFAAWPLRRPLEEDNAHIVWRKRNGQAVFMPFDIANAGGEVYGTVISANPPSPWVLIHFDVDDRGVRIDLLDSKLAGSGDRILMSRSHKPFTFGDGQLLYFRVTGNGTVKGASGIPASTLDIRDFADRDDRDPDLTFGLPIPTNDWYAEPPGLDPQEAAKLRVRAAAPTKLSPPDNPAGAIPGGTDPDAETDRIMNIVGPGLVYPWLEAGFADPGKAPTAQVYSPHGHTTPLGKKLTVNAPVTPSLFTMAVDPQIARYLGLATIVKTPVREPANMWLIASRWAVQPGRVLRAIDEAILEAIDYLTPTGGSGYPTPPVRLGAFLGSAGDVPPFVNATLDRVFPAAHAIIDRLPAIPDPDGSGPWTCVTLMALAVAPTGAPPDPPDRFELAAHEPGTWNAQADPDAPGAESWRQAISLGARPARGMVGFARMSPGEPVALHQVVPARGQPTARVLPLVPNWASNRERVVTDRFVPPGPAGGKWQVWQADEFGQWSDGAPFAAPLPARPPPPVPVAEATYSALPDDRSGGSRVPGTIQLTVEVPTPSKSAPGSLPIAILDVTVNGLPKASIHVAPGGTVRHDFQPPPFGVGEHRPVTIVATYTDSGTRTSPAQTLECGVFDARAPQAVPTSPLVIWTGQPDATGQAELALKWPPRAGAARYRIYLGDLRRLAGAAGLDLTGSAVRAADAKPLHDASATFADKHLFTFLGETPGTPEADGKIHYSTRIPASLRGLQFARIVPTTQGGAEAPFAGCGLVPVAIPGSDRPAPPAVQAVRNPSNGVTVTIRARGLRQEILDAGAGKPPEYRIRRTRRADANRDYIPLQPEGGALTGPDAEGVWTVGFTTPPAKLDPFVRYWWFAEVRYPPEPAIPPHAAPEPVDGGIEPAWTTLGSDSEAVWSPPSLASESLLIPAHDPQPPAPPALSTHPDGTTEIHIQNLPAAAPDAIGAYQLEVYRVRRNQAPALVAALTPASSEISWIDTAPPPPTDGYALILVDPIGRRSPPATVTAPLVEVPDVNAIGMETFETGNQYAGIRSRLRFHFFQVPAAGPADDDRIDMTPPAGSRVAPGTTIECAVHVWDG